MNGLLTKKRVLFVNTAIHTTSTGRIVEQLGKEVIRQGGECIALHGARYNSRSAIPTHLIDGKWNEYLHGMAGRLNMHGLGSVIATHRLIKKIRQWKPDLLHLHNIHGYYLNYPMLMRFLSQYRVPTVWTLHDCWPMTGRCAYFTSQECQQWQSGCLKCPSRSDYPKAITNTGTSRNYELKKRYFGLVQNIHIVSVSEWLNEVVGISFLADKPHEVIANGVDTEQFKPSESDWRKRLGIEGKFVVLGVANVWTTEKGLNDWKTLAESLDDRFALVMVGKTPCELPHPIIHVKKTESITQLSELYSMADVLVSLSKQETFGMTLIESLACGTPIMAYANTAQKELCDSKVGFPIPNNDLEAVVERLKQLIGSTELKDKAASCREFAIAHYSLQHHLQQYMDLYRTLLS